MVDYETHGLLPRIDALREISGYTKNNTKKLDYLRCDVDSRSNILGIEKLVLDSTILSNKK